MIQSVKKIIRIKQTLFAQDQKTAVHKNHGHPDRITK